MFGFTIAQKQSLTPDDIAALSTAYCGLCQTLRRRFGPLSAILTSHDALFLVILAAAQRDIPPTLGQPTRCPLCGYLKTENTIGDLQALEFAATVSVLLVGEKLRDDVRDEGHLHQVLALQSLYRALVRADDLLAASGFPRDMVSQIRESQRDIEHSLPGSLAASLEPTAQTVSVVLAHTAHIAGKPANAPVLASLGRSLGRIVALADACEDFSRDRRQHSYNPLYILWSLGASDPTPIEVIQEACALIAKEICNIRFCLQNLRLAWFSELIGNILSQGFPYRTCLALGRMWHGNHWTGRLPERVLGNFPETCFCDQCGLPHLHAKEMSTATRKASEQSLWLLGTLVPTAPEYARDLGFQDEKEYFLASALPLIASRNTAIERPYSRIKAARGAIRRTCHSVLRITS